jgi:hypothetical protein
MILAGVVFEHKSDATLRKFLAAVLWALVIVR